MKCIIGSILFVWCFTGIQAGVHRHRKVPVAKIIGLMPVRNESPSIEQSLKALACYVDAIVVLDDASTDTTVEVVKKCAKECKVRHIITKSRWYRDEPGDRNALLRAGRKLGGTHFVVIDADEMFTSNCQEDQFLRRRILSLTPGDTLAVNWIQLWRSVDYYRFDGSLWTWNYKSVIFCDDKKARYTSDFIHTARVPNFTSGKSYKIKGYTYGLLHFQFVNWRNLLVKQAWYRCLERIRNPKKSSSSINATYAASKDERNIHLEPAPRAWFERYQFFTEKLFAVPEQWREKQVLSWFKRYGREKFADLDIWDIDWESGIAIYR
jgi:glycosyltransferase involved in cell wall biosynthesis